MTLRQCQALDVASFVFTLLFVLEMAVKLVGLGVRGYLSDRVNVFDGVIVVINVVEVVVSSAHTGSPWAVTECATGLNFSVFRALRLVRLLYMIPSRSLHELIEILMGTLTKTVALSLIVLLFLFVGTLVGMSYFGGRLERCQPCTPLPRPLDLPITHGAIGAALTDFTSAATGATYSAPALGVGIEPSGAVGAQAASLCACHPELRVCLAPSATDVAPLPFLNAGLPTSAEGAAAGCFARTPYAHFDTFGASLLTTFQIFTGEEWAYPMFLSMRNVHPSTALFFTSRSSSAVTSCSTCTRPPSSLRSSCAQSEAEEGGGRRGGCDEARGACRGGLDPPPRLRPVRRRWRKGQKPGAAGDGPRRVRAAPQTGEREAASSAEWRLVVRTGLACSPQWQERGLADDGR